MELERIKAKLKEFPDKRLLLLAGAILLLLFIPLGSKDAAPAPHREKIPVSLDSKNLAPKIKAAVHPSKVRSGDEMLVTAVVRDVHGVTSVVADMGGIEQLHLSLINGTAHEGTWQATWKVHSTEAKEYMTTVIATSVVGISSYTTITWSDPLESLWSESNYQAGQNSDLTITDSTNADGSTTGTWASASGKWLNENWIFIMENTSQPSFYTINSVTLYLKHYQSGASGDTFSIQISPDEGSSWYELWSGTNPPTSDTTDSWDVSAYINTWDKVNKTRVKITSTAKQGGEDTVTWYVDTVELRIDYTLPVLTVSGTSRAPSTVQQGQNNVLMENLTFSSSTGTISVEVINITLGGNVSDGNITAVKLFNDTNKDGSYGAGDIQIDSKTFSNGVATFGTPGTTLFTVTSGTNESILILYDIASDASIGYAVGVNITSENNITVASPATVSSANFPITSAESIITEAGPSVLTVSGTSRAPSTVQQGESNVLMENLTFSSSIGTISVEVINITLGGNVSDGNITAVRLFNDTNKDGSYDGGDIQIDSDKTFSNGVATFGTPGTTLFNVTQGSDESILILYDIASDASIGYAVGVNITSENNITVASPATVSSANFPIASSESVIVAAVPPKPRVLGYLDQYVYWFGKASGVWAVPDDDGDNVTWPGGANPSADRETQIKEMSTIRVFVLVLDADGTPLSGQPVKVWIINDDNYQLNKTATDLGDGRYTAVFEGWRSADNTSWGADYNYIWGKFTSRQTYNVSVDYNDDGIADLQLPFMAYCVLDTYWTVEGAPDVGKYSDHCEGGRGCDPHADQHSDTPYSPYRSTEPNCQDCHGYSAAAGSLIGSGSASAAKLNYGAVHPRSGATSYMDCASLNCHNFSGILPADMPVPGWPAGTYNTTNPWYGNSTWTNTSWCASSGCHDGTYTPFKDGIIPQREGHNKNISCKYCHSDHIHSTPTIEDTPGYNTSYPGTCYQSCHKTQVKHNNVVSCQSCHTNASTAPMHQQNLSSKYTTCGSCHQNNGYPTAPQIPYPLTHSDDENAGWKWNKTSAIYWNDSKGDFGNSSCAYCHGRTFMKASALGRPANWMGANTINSSINATNSWCAGCHYQNYTSGGDSYGDMTSTFTGDGLPVPPEITNHSVYAPDELPGYYLHSFTSAPYYNDSQCFGCHGTLATEATNITAFMHKVAIGKGCTGCHFSWSTMSSNPTKFINQTLFESSVHGNESVITCEDCHTNTTGHPGSTNPPQSGWKWCEDCHVIQPTYPNLTPLITVQQRHNLTDRPLDVYYNVSGTLKNPLQITQCTFCHDATLYSNAVATYTDCRFCHTFPDLEPGGD
jgi:hypothetical protein